MLSNATSGLSEMRFRFGPDVRSGTAFRARKRDGDAAPSAPNAIRSTVSNVLSAASVVSMSVGGPATPLTPTAGPRPGPGITA